MSYRAFIFDLDGVVVDSEPYWEKIKPILLSDLFGQEIFTKLGSTLGVDLDTIYQKGVDLGSKVDKEYFRNAVFEAALKIYKNAPLTANLDKLANFLKENDFRIALVSASPDLWIQAVLDRLDFKDDIEIIISLYEIDRLKHKPAPDGYLEAMKRLGVEPPRTVILEDSNVGIASAKASGAYTIGLRANLVEGYSQDGADEFADDINEVIEILQRLLR